MIPLVYHPGYNITAFGLERLHPFDGRKYGRIHNALIARGIRRRSDFVRPRLVFQRELLRVHSPEYLRLLKGPDLVSRILEIPIASRLPGWLIDWRILRPMRYATGGTIRACELALEHGIAINLGGGFHHASGDQGEGFCVYADVPLAVALLHDAAKVRRVLVVDLDAHQGNGTAIVFRNWDWAFILDLYEVDIFPHRKEPEDYSISVSSGLSGGEYLNLVADALPEALEELRPDLVIYNAGSDPFLGDPLANFRLSRTDLAERDLLVATEVRMRRIPMAMVLSGGYSEESWRIHTDSIEGILTRFD